MGDREYNAEYWGSQSLSSSKPASSQNQSADPFAVVDDSQSDGAKSAQTQEDSRARSGFAANQPPFQQHPGYGYQGQQPNRQPYTYHSGKDHVAAGLLAIFLGGLGIHKFYLGYNSVGFIMLGVTILGSIFTLGLAGLVMELIGIIEGIIYLSKDQNSFDWTYVYNMKEWF